MDDVQRQLAGIGKGMVQLNLRLSRLVELAEAGPSGATDSGPALDLLFDLVEATERTLASARLPAPTLWSRLFRPAPAIDLQGLALARDHVLAQLQQAGIQPIPTDGPADPRLHQIIEVQAPSDPALAGTIAHTHRTGWVRSGDPAQVLRLAQVTAWRHPET